VELWSGLRMIGQLNMHSQSRIIKEKERVYLNTNGHGYFIGGNLEQPHHLKYYL
jgi:hypothetical protein